MLIRPDKLTRRVLFLVFLFCVASQAEEIRLDLEDPLEREKLPLYKTLPAAAPEELTPALESPRDGRWYRSHGNEANTRYSDLDQIDRTNVADLEVAWTYHSGDRTGNIQCNPVIVEGVMYAPTVGGHVVAIDATNGEEKWRFKPEGRPAFRGLLYWEGVGTVAPRLYFSSGEDLWALDPGTGAPVPTFGERGRVPMGESRVAPAVYRNFLVIPGYWKDVYGLDAVTGRRLWTFHTIPEPGEFGYDTWDGTEKGANCWGGMALDSERGIAYVATGSPKPDFVGVYHRGDNLFANCVIAIDVTTGRRLWHFQEIRHDIWDLDIPAPPNLVTVTRHGKRVDAVAQVTKLGNTLLLDRVTGKPLYPFRLRRAPASKLPGERTSPYQPDVEIPEPFSRQVFSASELTDLSYEAADYVSKRVAGANYGWFEPFEENKPTILYGVHGGAEWTGASFDPTNGRLYVSANELPWAITVFRPEPDYRDPNAPPTRGMQVYAKYCVECHGANRVGSGMAPPLQGLGRRLDDAAVLELLETGRNAMPIPPPMTDQERADLLDFLFGRDLDPEYVAKVDPTPQKYTHNGYPKLLDREGYPGSEPPWGTLNCLDLNSGKLVWKVPLGYYTDLAVFFGETETGAENFGGAMATAGGLVFCAGTPDEMIRAFDSDTGDILWETKLPWGGYAPPATYEVDGRQYVVIAATGGGKLGGPMGDAYVAFALPKKTN